MSITPQTKVSVALIVSLCSGFAYAVDKYEVMTQRLSRTEEAVEWIKAHETEQSRDIKLLLNKLDDNSRDTITNKANIESIRKVVDKWEGTNWD